MSRVRVEEKLLMEELSARGANLVKFDDRELFFDLNRP
ncbi:MAG: lysine biosynthesis protein LysX, partial [Thermomicrobiales bacterium]